MAEKRIFEAISPDDLKVHEFEIEVPDNEELKRMLSPPLTQSGRDQIVLGARKVFSPVGIILIILLSAIIFGIIYFPVYQEKIETDQRVANLSKEKQESERRVREKELEVEKERQEKITAEEKIKMAEEARRKAEQKAQEEVRLRAEQEAERRRLEEEQRVKESQEVVRLIEENQKKLAEQKILEEERRQLEAEKERLIKKQQHLAAVKTEIDKSTGDDQLVGERVITSSVKYLNAESKTCLSVSRVEWHDLSNYVSFWVERKCNDESIGLDFCEVLSPSHSSTFDGNCFEYKDCDDARLQYGGSVCVKKIKLHGYKEPEYYEFSYDDFVGWDDEKVSIMFYYVESKCQDYEFTGRRILCNNYIETRRIGFILEGRD